MRIREFRAGDEEALRRIFVRAIRETASKDYSDEQVRTWAPDQWDREVWGKRLQGIAPFVAEEEGEAVAYADVQPEGYIDQFFVSPDVGRRGVGSALMRRIHEKAEELRLESLWSNVSITARPFFEKWGFEVVEQQSVHIGDVAFTNFRMRKSLAPNLHGGT